MKNLSSVVAVAGVLFLSSALQAEVAGSTCKMDFTVKKTSTLNHYIQGSGTMSCSNGQKTRIKIRGQGEKLALEDVWEGHGDFTKVPDMSELYGTYTKAKTHKKAIDSLQLLTKGEINLTLLEMEKNEKLDLTFRKLVISEDRHAEN